MKCHFEIFKDQKLIITYYNGIIELDDIKGNMIELNKHPDYSANYNVINDFSRCVLNINYEEVTFYINFLKNDLVL